MGRAGSELDRFMAPKSVAVIGASPDRTKIRGLLLEQLRAGGFAGAIYAINPGYQEIDGLACYPALAAVVASERTGHFGGSPAEIRRTYQHGIQRIPIAMYNLEVPAIAAVNGHAVGAGCDLSLMCDIRIAAEDAEFAESFMRMGLVSGDGGAWFLSRLVGPSRAAEMTFTGEFIKAPEAYRLGIVSRVVPTADLMESARALAQRIAAQPPHSLRMCKKLLREAPAVTLPAHLEMVAGMQALVQHTADQREAVTAFFEKRKPIFTGT